MRVAITGASGNVGTSLLHALASRPDVDSILGLARRPPAMAFPKTTWTHADVAWSDLQVAGSLGDPAAVSWTLPALAAGTSGTDPHLSRRARTAIPVRALIR